MLIPELECLQNVLSRMRHDSESCARGVATISSSAMQYLATSPDELRQAVPYLTDITLVPERHLPETFVQDSNLERITSLILRRFIPERLEALQSALASDDLLRSTRALMECIHDVRFGHITDPAMLHTLHEYLLNQMESGDYTERQRKQMYKDLHLIKVQIEDASVLSTQSLKSDFQINIKDEDPGSQDVKIRLDPPPPEFES